MNEIKKLKNLIKTFTQEREWEKFHSPKNLSIALTKECSEIMEIFQWMNEEESYNLTEIKLVELKDEIGDVLIYLLNLCDKFNIDPIQSAKEKIKKNIEKYPKEIVKGSSKKYNEY